eukprot:m.8164 g.8164  ORF g.8164 m.8164 type:complete len:300 (+) comp5327_c0_seq1:680-1579(+)
MAQHQPLSYTCVALCRFSMSRHLKSVHRGHRRCHSCWVQRWLDVFENSTSYHRACVQAHFFASTHHDIEWKPSCANSNVKHHQFNVGVVVDILLHLCAGGSAIKLAPKQLTVDTHHVWHTLLGTLLLFHSNQRLLVVLFLLIIAVSCCCCSRLLWHKLGYSITTGAAFGHRHSLLLHRCLVLRQINITLLTCKLGQLNQVFLVLGQDLATVEKVLAILEIAVPTSWHQLACLRHHDLEVASVHLLSCHHLSISMCNHPFCINVVNLWVLVEHRLCAFGTLGTSCLRHCFNNVINLANFT